MASSLGVHASKTYTFQEGVNGYAGTVDTQFRFGSPDRNDANLGVLSIDGSDGGGANHVLLRFENLAGTGAGQIPPGSTVLFATLTLYFVDPGNDPGLHRMLKPWAETNTWNQFDPDALDGVTPDGVEAAVDPDATLEAGNPVPVFTPVDLLPKTIQDWLDGKAPNYGWFFMPSGGGGADFVTSEGSVITQRPLLTVVVGTLGELWLKSVSPGNGATDVPVDANLTFIV
ncbi:MAG: DNRLRE domain-containing protein, partial [Verrucomicrobia bacterium]|nr:DNRLRE domain-containing protein [Verrucomicrobiota bacterium]